MPVAKKDVSEEKDKPVFDEQTLAKLLEAAFVLQEHNREQQTPDLNLEPQTEKLGEQRQPSGLERHDTAASSGRTESASPDDYTPTLAQIVEVQHEIQVRHLELEGALALVAERVTDIAKAGGAGIGILNGKKVQYQAVAGLMTLPADTEVSMEKALSVACLRTGQVLSCADVNPEFLLDAGECHRRGIQSMIAVPVYHDGGIAGALELYYARTQAFAEQDVHTCQLMAGLITEALAREEELTRKKLPAAERAAMLEALEKLKPSLAALLDSPAAKAPATASSGSIFICRKCGHQLLGQEQFCGKCGLPRSSEYEPPSMQSKVASLWNMQEAKKKSVAAPPVKDEIAHEDPVAISGHAGPEKPLADSIEEEMPELFAAPEARIGNVSEPADLSHEAELTPEMISDAIGELGLPDLPLEGGAEEREEEATPPAETALAVQPRVTAWSSAASARDFLEKLAPNRRGTLARLLQARRGDVYLAVAVILVVFVLGWGIWSNHSVGATGGSAAAAGHRKPAPDSDLSWFDRMLVDLGLAEAPAPPASKGNPDTQVWVDLQTALYYCPGADLYGKTPKGKFAAQRDAQLDQFQPASRKPCE